MLINHEVRDDESRAGISYALALRINKMGLHPETVGQTRQY